MPLHE